MNEQNLLEDLLKKKGGKKQKEEPKKKRKKSSLPYSSKAPRKQSKSHEIMLKIAGGSGSGHGHNASQLKACLHYIIKGSEHGTVETSLGEEINHAQVDDKIEQYTIGFKQSPSSSLRKNRLFTHAIISLPNNVTEYSKYKDYNNKELQSIFKQALKATMQDLFPFNDYLLAMHDNGNNLHAHLPILCKGADGKKIRINKKELQQIRKALVNNLKDKGLNLKATSFLDQQREKQEQEQNKEKTQKQKLKRIHLEQGFKVGKAYQAKAPSWVRNKNNLLVKNNYQIDLNKCNNKRQENKMLELQERFNKVFEDGETALKSFLMLYKENKSLATWSLFKNTKVFGLIKEEFRANRSNTTDVDNSLNNYKTQPKTLNATNNKNQTYSNTQNQKINKTINQVNNELRKKALQKELDGLLLRNIEVGVLVNLGKGRGVLEK